MTNIDFPQGASAGGGRYTIDRWIRGSSSGGRLVGHDNSTGKLVHVAYSTSTTKSTAELRERLDRTVPGVAPCVFVGEIDASGQFTEAVLVIEELGPSVSLTDANRSLTDVAKIRLVSDVANTAARAAHANHSIGGLHPDLIWLDRERTLSPILTPRFPLLSATRKPEKATGYPPSAFSDIGPFVDPAVLNPWLRTSMSDAYLVGMISYWMFNAKHPFTEASRRCQHDWLWAMENEPPDPFAGPPRIGEILERILVADPGRRMPMIELAAALESVALATE
jgi:hypothetical protein